jgi:hypothetical protein
MRCERGRILYVLIKSGRDLIHTSRHKMRRGGIFTSICCPLNTLRHILQNKEKRETQPYKYREKIEE